jgi:hypothetical protein
MCSYYCDPCGYDCNYGTAEMLAWHNMTVHASDVPAVLAVETPRVQPPSVIFPPLPLPLPLPLSIVAQYVDDEKSISDTQSFDEAMRSENYADNSESLDVTSPVSSPTRPILKGILRRPTSETDAPARKKRRVDFTLPNKNMVFEYKRDNTFYKFRSPNFDNKINVEEEEGEIK